MIEKLDTAELAKIIACEDLDKLEQNNNAASLLRLFWQPRLKHINNKSSALAFAIKKSVGPVETWWLIASVVTMGAVGATAFPLTIIFIASGLLLGAYHYSRSLPRHQREAKETEQFFQWAELKLLVTEELIRRENLHITHLQRELEVSKNMSFIKPVYFSEKIIVSKKDKKPSKNTAVLAGMAATGYIALTGLAIGSLFDLLGYITIASALGGPIGLGIALGAVLISVGVGMFIAHKNYQTQKSKYAIENKKNTATDLLKEKQQEYALLSKKREALEITALARNTDVKEIETTIQSASSGVALNRSMLFSAKNNSNKRTPEFLGGYNGLYAWWRDQSKLSWYQARSKQTMLLDSAIKKFSDLVIFEGSEFESLNELLVAVMLWKKEQTFCSDRVDFVNGLENYLQGEIERVSVIDASQHRLSA